MKSVTSLVLNLLTMNCTYNISLLHSIYHYQISQQLSCLLNKLSKKGWRTEPYGSACYFSMSCLTDIMDI
jgi:hypothetical protein